MPVGGEVINEGVWFDIGNLQAYMEVHQALTVGGHQLSYLPPDWLEPIQIGARVDDEAIITGCSSVAAGAEVEKFATHENVIVWPGANVNAGLALKNSIVTPSGVCQSDCGSLDASAHSSTQ
jgi:NDP-sugar pyrophosphorylase family protein